MGNTRRFGQDVTRGGRKYPWRLFLSCFAMLIVSLDQYIVVVALPDIGRDLGYSARTLQLVVSAYAIASSGFLLLGGRATDLLGRRRMLAVGLAVYAIASYAGGAATSPATQLAARAVQGIGGALVFPATLAIITTTYDQGRERNRALSIWGAAGAAGLVVGVLLGGFLTRSLAWSSVFFINVPLASIALVLAFVVVPKDPPIERTRRFDLMGALTATSAVTLVVWSLVQAPERGWSAAPVIGPVAVGVALGLMFIRIERRARDPLVPLALLKNPFLRLAVVLGFMFMATFGSLLYFVSIYLQDVLRYDALQTGLGFLAPTAVVVAASALAGPAATRIGLKAVCLTALTVGAIGASGLGLAVAADAEYVDLLPGLILVSVGDGLMFTSMFIAAATGVTAQSQGVASAIVSTGSGVGAAVGLALLVLVANPGAEMVDAEAFRNAAADGIRAAVLAIAAGIAATLAGMLVTYPRGRTHLRGAPPDHGNIASIACGPSAGLSCRPAES